LLLKLANDGHPALLLSKFNASNFSKISSSDIIEQAATADKWCDILRPENIFPIP